MRELLRLLLAGLLLILAACQTHVPPPMGEVGGRVTAEDGAPVAGATVTLVLEGAAVSATAKTATTDASGNFTIPEVLVGTYGLTVVGGGRGAFEPAVTVVQDETTTVDLEASLLGAIAGTVLLQDADRRPEAHAGIDVFLPGTPFATKTAVNGAFTLAGVPEGTYTLSLRAPGYEPVDRTVSVAPGQTTPLSETITLGRRAPYASFTLSVDGASVTVDASASFDPDGVIAVYAWDFGDGGKATGVRASHTYGSSGDKTISLTVVDDAGNSDVASQSVTVSVPQVVVSRDPNAAVALPPLAAGESVRFEVWLPPAVARGNDLLYLELDRADAGLVLEASDGAQVYYSTTPDRFALDPGSLGAAPATVAPQAVVTSAVCRGPCILLPATGGAVLVGVTNPSPGVVSASLYAYVDTFSDASEPNDALASATPLADTDSGAIELIGDQDYYRVGRSGLLRFESSAAIALSAEVLGPTGSRVTTLRPGEAAPVRAGDHVVVRAEGASAAVSGSSLYFVTLE